MKTMLIVKEKATHNKLKLQPTNLEKQLVVLYIHTNRHDVKTVAFG